MSYRVVAVAILCILFACDSLRSQDKIPERSPVPDAEAMEAANKLVDQKYQRKLASAKSFADRSAIGYEMLRAAEEATDDVAFRYVLLNRAISMCVEGRSTYFMVDAVRELRAHFDADTLALEVDAIRQLSKFVKEGDENKMTWLIHHAVSLAIDADQYDLATDICTLALTEFKRFKTPVFKSSMKELANEVSRLKDEFDSLTTQIEAAKQDEANAEAALAVGKFRCFQQKNWSKGLALLARGSDAALAKVATCELEQLDPDADATMQIDRYRMIAEGWYDYSQTVTDFAQEESQKRSLSWSRKLLMQLADSPEATLVSRRIDELERAIPIGSVPWGATSTYSFEKPTWKLTRQNQVVADVNGRICTAGVPCKIELKAGTMADGKAGKGLSLARTGDRDLVHGIDYLQDAVSLCCWVNLRDWPSNDLNDVYIVGSLDFKFGGHGLAINSQSAGFIIGSAGKLVHCRFTPKTELQTNVWYHLAGTYDGRQLKMYVNGCPAAPTIHPGKITGAFSLPQIGRDKSESGRGFVGSIDELIFFNRPLSDEEVDTLYRRGLRGKSFSD
jgi:hypothetical protein